MLTGKTAFAQNLRGGIVSHHLWRFADLTTRLEFLLGGFGWCNMPHHMVEDHVAAGRLKRLVLADEAAPMFRLYVASERGRELGRAGKWLVADLRERLKTCPGVAQARDARRRESGGGKAGAGDRRRRADRLIARGRNSARTPETGSTPDLARKTCAVATTVKSPQGNSEGYRALLSRPYSKSIATMTTP